MMAEVLIKNPVCSKCGEEARAHALFCYACGGEIIEAGSENMVSSAWFKEDIVSDGLRAVETNEGVEASEFGSETDVSEELVEGVDSSHEVVDSKDHSPASAVESKTVNVSPFLLEKKEERAKLTSAAELQKRPKPFHAKRVEVVWREKSESPNLIFIVFGIIFVSLAVLIFFATLYLK